MNQRIQDKFILDSLYTNVAIKSTEIFQIKIFSSILIKPKIGSKFLVIINYQMTLVNNQDW